ncbi:secreted RxLR effector protein 161-like [Pistacia vera]|uniref:secreted RxLR effector protein 161-like n=1 Tax=Pistacia vera TaxID=55513 RepID=UPI001263AD94|nr:secreted RxLR effector protein 161-like [Pistacia vera]
MYAMISTRPDLSFVISLLSRYMSNPGMEHWIALKWVLKYVNGSLNVGLEYCKMTASLELVGFVDSDFAGDKDTRKSTTAYYFTLGGNCISWKSQLQPIVVLSSTEAEYVAVTNVFKEAI